MNCIEHLGENLEPDEVSEILEEDKKRICNYALECIGRKLSADNTMA